MGYPLFSGSCCMRTIQPVPHNRAGFMCVFGVDCAKLSYTERKKKKKKDNRSEINCKPESSSELGGNKS